MTEEKTSSSLKVGDLVRHKTRNLGIWPDDIVIGVLIESKSCRIAGSLSWKILTSNGFRYYIDDVLELLE